MISAIIFIAVTIVILIAIGTASYFGASIAISKKKYIITADKDKDELTLTPVKDDSQKAEFLEEADQEQLDEMELSPGWRNFFKKFVKPRR